jgi:ABC-2 type transport system permease protein
MRKILIVAFREYRASVKTKSFIIMLIIMPIMMGGSMAVSFLTRDKVDTEDKKFVVIDRSELFSETLEQRVKQRNENEIFHPQTHEKIKPAYILEFVEFNASDSLKQKLELSDRVIEKELYGFIEIGRSVLHPLSDPANSYVRFYSESDFLDETRIWFIGPINEHLRQLRMTDLKLSSDSTQELFMMTDVEGLSLLKKDENTGEIKGAEKSNVIQSIIIPYVMVLLMFMIVMMGTTPLLNAVMEEKMEKIAEVLLATITPYQFMTGKILGSTLVSLTTALIYVIGGIFMAQQSGAGDMIPYKLLPWFFVYLIFFLIMAGSMMAALGSACNDNKDAQNVSFPANLPLIIPLFVIFPILQNPAGSLATWLSLFPPFTPLLMIVRQSTPVAIPAWQPWVGIAGMILFTAFSVWVGARIFRTGILMQGQKPTLANLFKYAFKRS